MRIRNLTLIYLNWVITVTQEHRTQFIFRTQITIAGLVGEFVNELEDCPNPQFLIEPSSDGHFHRFTLAGMTAATIGPKKRPQSFLRATLLQKQFTLRIEYEKRKRPMQNTIAIVAPCFAQRANLGIILIDKNEVFVFRRDNSVHIRRQ